MAGQCQRCEAIAFDTVVEKKRDYTMEIKKHGRKEHLAAAGAVLGGAVALYEKRQAKKDPANAHKHRISEAIAGAVALGTGTYALHERKDKKEAEKQAKYQHW